MHIVSDRYNQAFESGEYNYAYEMRFTPCGKDIANMRQPVFENYLVSRVPDVLNARSAYAETLFECNTDRSGTMYLMSCTDVDTAARSAEYAKSDCTFDNPLAMTIDLHRLDGTVIDYTTVGFSTGCKNGNYAAEYQIVYYRGDEWAQTVTYRNNVGVSESAVKIPQIPYDDVNKLKIIIKKWCRPKARAVISCVFIGAAPFVITNDDITALPTTFKELESDSKDGVGAPSSNQFTFSFFDKNNLGGESYAADTKIALACGIKTENGQELMPYGSYYITSGTKDKDIISITAQDDLSDVMGGTKSNFVERVDSLYCSYSEYIEKLLPGIEIDLDSAFSAALGDKSNGFKAVRGASISDQCNEFCTLTGTCINYDDNGKKRLYQRYNDSALPVAEYDDENIVGSVVTTVRPVPDIVKISVHTAVLNQTADTPCFDGEKIEIPPLEIALTDITNVDVNYENGDTVINFEPYSEIADDFIYSTNATFRRQLYNFGGVQKDNSFVVHSRGNYTYSKDDCTVRYFSFGRDKRTFAVESYICPVLNKKANGDTDKTVEMSIYSGAAKWIYDWFEKTRVERTFQILTDFRLEVGDIVSVNGILGEIYRIETNGTLSTITIRSEN